MSRIGNDVLGGASFTDTTALSLFLFALNTTNPGASSVDPSSGTSSEQKMLANGPVSGYFWAAADAGEASSSRAAADARAADRPVRTVIISASFLRGDVRPRHRSW